MANAFGRQIIPDGRKSTDVEIVIQPIGCAGMLKDPIGKGRGEDGRKIPVAGGVVARERGTEREILFAIVAYGVQAIVRGLKKTVHLAAIHLGAPACITVVGIGIGASGKIGR